MSEYKVTYRHLVPIDVIWIVAGLAIAILLVVAGVVWLKRSRHDPRP